MNRVEAKWVLMREVVRLRVQPYAQWRVRLDRSPFSVPRRPSPTDVAQSLKQCY